MFQPLRSLSRNNCNSWKCEIIQQCWQCLLTMFWQCFLFSYCTKYKHPCRVMRELKCRRLISLCTIGEWCTWMTRSQMILRMLQGNCFFFCCSAWTDTPQQSTTSSKRTYSRREDSLSLSLWQVRTLQVLPFPVMSPTETVTVQSLWSLTFICEGQTISAKQRRDLICQMCKNKKCVDVFFLCDILRKFCILLCMFRR